MDDVGTPSSNHKNDVSSVEIWLANLQDLEVPLEKISKSYPLLSSDEFQEFADTEKTTRQRMRRTARMVLRLLLSRFFGSPIARQSFDLGQQGKPILRGLQGDFNLAHAGGYALVALGSISPIGVDLETLRDVRISPNRRSAMIAAAEDVASGEPLPDLESARSLQAWTRLEALAKAEGQGIGRVLARYGIWGSARELKTIEREKKLSLTVHDLDVGLSNLHAAVCLPVGVEVPQVSSLPSHEDGLLRVLSQNEIGSNQTGVDLRRLARQKVLDGA